MRQWNMFTELRAILGGDDPAKAVAAMAIRMASA